VDKTGTLTQNRMSIQQLSVLDKIFKAEPGHTELLEDFHELLEFAALLSEINIFILWKILFMNWPYNF
jgi:P-type E1-E2 ATPase